MLWIRKTALRLLVASRAFRQSWKTYGDEEMWRYPMDAKDDI